MPRLRLEPCFSVPQTDVMTHYTTKTGVVVYVFTLYLYPVTHLLFLFREKEPSFLLNKQCGDSLLLTSA